MVDDLSGIGGDSIGARNKKMQVEKKQQKKEKKLVSVGNTGTKDGSVTIFSPGLGVPVCNP